MHRVKIDPILDAKETIQVSYRIFAGGGFRNSEIDIIIAYFLRRVWGHALPEKF